MRWFRKGGCFSFIQRGSTFRSIDRFVRRRLRPILRKRLKQPGFGRSHRGHLRWPIAFFAAHGLLTLHEAHVLARQSR